MTTPSAELIVNTDGVEAVRKTVPVGEYVVGRDPHCDISIDSSKVSRYHARLKISADGLSIEDLDSHNGTYVDGHRINGVICLAADQSIRIGPATIEVRRPNVEKSDAGEVEPMDSERIMLPAELQSAKKYDVGEIIARGGMGAIHDAKELTTGRAVAMKVMLGVASRVAVMRFIAEAKVTACLEHPNIVPVHELSVDENGQVFYTMKFVRGMTLRVVLEKLREHDKRTLAGYSLPSLLTIFQKVCDAMAFAHSKNVIHRDLKPDNIMIGDYGEVLVMDWGLAKIAGENELSREVINSIDFAFATMDGKVMGTPKYMSPEQARGEVEDLDTRTDIYALGAILYTMLSLRPPVNGITASEVVQKVAKGEIIPLAKAVAEANAPLYHLPGGRAPDSLEAVVRKAMDFDRELRYPKVEGLQADVTAYQSGFATGAEKAGTAKHVLLFIKRHKAVSIAVTVGLSVLFMISAVFTFRVLYEKNVAVTAKLRAEAEQKRAEDALGTAEAQRQRAEQALGTADSERQRALAALAREEKERQLANTERQRAEQALGTAEDERKRAELERGRAQQALTDLARTAPTFFALAKSLLEEGKFGEAIEKLGYAIQLDDQNADYHLFRADLLEATQQLTAAMEEYRRVIAIRPVDAVASTNLTLCERLLRENGNAPSLKKAIQKELLIALREQKRLIEAGPLSAIVEPDVALIEAALRGKLREYRKQAGWDDSRLTRLPDGMFRLTLDNLALGNLSILKGQAISDLSLSYTEISDLRPLAGLPLKRLVLNYTKVTDLSPLLGAPLENLDLVGLPIADLTSLAGFKLRHLNLNRTQVSDLGPLAGMPLQYISANNTRIADLTVLRSMPLDYVNFSASHISDLGPLSGTPITELDISYNRVTTLAELGKCLKLQRLSLSHTAVSDLAPLTKLGLIELDFSDTSVTSLAALRGQPLQKLRMDKVSITNFSPLLECNSLREIVLPADATNLAPLRSMSFLRFISGDHAPQSAAEFWKEYDAKKRPKAN